MTISRIRGAPSGMSSRSSIRHRHAGLLILTLILLISDAATRSFFTVIFFGDASFGIGLMASLATIAVFTGISIVSRDIFIVAIFAAITSFFLFFYLYFWYGTNRVVSLNSLGGYYGVLTFIAFYELARRNLLTVAMRMMLIIYLAYLVVYSIISFGDSLGIDLIYFSSKVPVDLSDPNRGRRLYLFQGAAVYVAMYAFSMLQVKFSFRYLMALAISSFAMYASMSRVLILCSLLVLAIYLISRRLRLIQIVCFSLYLTISAYLIWGIFDDEFNPFWFAVTDSSALARRYQYEIVKNYIHTYPLFGIGLPGATEGLTNFLGKIVYPSDLGIVGVWFEFGLVGVVVLGIAMVYISCIQNINKSAAVLGQVDARTLSLVGSVLGLNEVIPHELFVGSALIFSFIFANTIYNARVFSAAR